MDCLFLKCFENIDITQVSLSRASGRNVMLAVELDALPSDAILSPRAKVQLHCATVPKLQQCSDH